MSVWINNAAVKPCQISTMTNNWVSTLLNAKKSCLKQNNLLKVHYALSDGRELVEEYNTSTDILTRRAWKVKNAVGDGDEWSIEIGDPEPTVVLKDGAFITENSNQPFIVKRITKRNIEWRIRNMPYPLEVYSVTADAENCLVVRTTNKKYFKKLPVPDLERANLKPEQDKIKFSHQFNTLIITYLKPKELLEMEKVILAEIKKLKASNEGDLECNPS